MKITPFSPDPDKYADECEPCNTRYNSRNKLMARRRCERPGPGHERIRFVTDANSSASVGYCRCGCGRITDTYKDSRPARGYVAGQHRAYIKGHENTGGRFTSPAFVDFIQQDTGYETPCWIWQRGASLCDGARYGTTKVGGAAVYAHRHYYAQLNGPIPDGAHIDHLCISRTGGNGGSTLCVNPAHLEAVTQVENSRRGKHCKLSIESAAQARQLYASGRYKQKEIAAMFGVHPSQISRAVTGERWT